MVQKTKLFIFWNLKGEFYSNNNYKYTQRWTSKLQHIFVAIVKISRIEILNLAAKWEVWTQKQSVGNARNTDKQQCKKREQLFTLSKNGVNVCTMNKSCKFSVGSKHLFSFSQTSENYQFTQTETNFSTAVIYQLAFVFDLYIFYFMKKAGRIWNRLEDSN